MNGKPVKEPIFIPTWIEGTRYWTKFEKIFEKLYPGVTANQAFVLGLALIGVFLSVGWLMIELYKR